MFYSKLAVFAALSAGLATSAVAQTILTSSNGVVRNSLCVGGDCQAGITFDDSTLILKENNTRIKFSDTSSTASFASRDWELEANSSANGGENHFAIVDCGTASNDGGCTSPNNVFTVEAGAGSSAVYIESTGDVGFGTNNPVVDLHVMDGDSPTLRLEQSGTSGFSPQSWDLAGNETNFFVRDVTNGSKLPFRIRPDTPTSALMLDDEAMIVNDGGNDYDFRVESDTEQNALFVDAATSRIGVGTNTPEQLLHIRSNVVDTDAFALFDAAASGSDAAFQLRQNGTVPTTWEFRNQQTSGRLNIGIAGGNTPLKIDDAANNNLFKIGLNGQPDVVEVTGRLLVNSTQLSVPDYVFADDYALRPLADVRSFIDTNSHLPEVPSALDIGRDGVDMTAMQMTLLKKVEELTLYTLAQEAELGGLKTEMAQIKAMLAEK